MVRLTVDTSLLDPAKVFYLHEGTFWIDMRSVSFIDPYGLVQVLARAHAARLRGHPVEVLPPAAFKPSSYCQRVDLFAALRRMGGTCNDPHPAHNRHPQGNWMAECREVSDTGDVHDVGNVLVNLLDESDWPPHTTDAIGLSLYEVCDNLLHHAMVKHGYSAMQALPNANRCQIAAGDAGVTIPHHHPAATDADSIVEALTKGVTSSSDKRRGKGFALMRDLLADVGGTLTVRSGAGKVVVPPGGAPHKMTTWPLPGTVVAIDVPLAR